MAGSAYILKVGGDTEDFARHRSTWRVSRRGAMISFALGTVFKTTVAGLMRPSWQGLDFALTPDGTYCGFKRMRVAFVFG